MGLAVAGARAWDEANSTFDGIIDPATGTVYARRAVNLNVASTGDYADQTAVLYGLDGNVLFAAAAAPGDADSAAIKGPYVNSRLQGYNPNDGDWDRIQTVEDNQSVATSSKGKLVVVPTVFDSSAFPALYAARQIGDNVSGSNMGATAVMMANGTGNYDRQYNNTQGTLLASAARTGTTSSANQTNYNGTKLVIFVNLTAVPSTTDTITPVIRLVDPVSGNSNAFSIGAAIVGNVGVPNTVTYELYPGATAASLTNSKDIFIPRVWFFQMQHSAGTSFTYSVGFGLNQGS